MARPKGIKDVRVVELDPKAERRLLSAYEDGVLIPDLVDRFGIGRERLYAILRKHGYDIKSSNGHGHWYFKSRV